mgnify:CR=1 FL=1
MAKRLSEKQKKDILNLFVDGKSSIDELSSKFEYSKTTIIRNLKKQLGDSKYKNLISSRNKFKLLKTSNETSEDEFVEDTSNFDKEILESSFVELAPLDCQIDNIPRKELSSVPIDEIEFPKIVYMIVDKNVELEIKLLKDYPDWEFLPPEDLKRKTIEIYFDLKIAKRTCSKEQKVIKVPNTDVFRIVAPKLIARGISRIISSDRLIAL